MLGYKIYIYIQIDKLKFISTGTLENPALADAALDRAMEKSEAARHKLALLVLQKIRDS